MSPKKKMLQQKQSHHAELVPIDGQEICEHAATWPGDVADCWISIRMVGFGGIAEGRQASSLGAVVSEVWVVVRLQRQPQRGEYGIVDERCRRTGLDGPWVATHLPGQSDCLRYPVAEGQLQGLVRGHAGLPDFQEPVAARVTT